MVTGRSGELATAIASYTKELEDYLEVKKLPPPSFEPGLSVEYSKDQKITSLRSKIMTATDELHALMQSPAAILTPRHNDLISLQAIVRFGLADCIPEGQDEITLAEICGRVPFPESTITRLLRHAAAHHIFQERRKGVFAHTAASQMLASNVHMQQWIGMVSEEMWPAATKTVDALSRWPASIRPENTGYNLAHDANGTIFDHLALLPARQQRYADAMSWFNTGPGFEPDHLINSYPWHQLGEGSLIVDVGGGNGSVSIALANRFPHLRLVVQDRLEVLANLRTTPDLLASGRVVFEAHDFFESQPRRDARVFYLRWVLHDWADEFAIKILRALVPAMDIHTKIVLSEYVVPEPGSVSFLQQKLYRQFDLSMWSIHNGKERDEQDWRKLFCEADERFHIVRIMEPAMSRLAIIEIGWKESVTQILPLIPDL